ncbi:MAG: Nif3-like dinuclear metal center hexameric protein [Candidatus Bathyarchaeota archaeon]|nr:Nif3-like dinuclear metal center hexameric protein [Candidatus Bathyarchaeota archaeon]
MNTEDIMKLALKLAGFKDIPEDSAIYVRGENIQKVLFCIDAGTAELLLAKQLGFDVVIAHHPTGGTAALNFPQVFKRHVQQMVEAGVPREVAEKAVSRKLEQLEVEAHTRNYLHTIEFARLLKMPYMNIHAPLDEIGRRRMIEQLNNKLRKDSKVEDVVSALMELPEFKNASTKIRICLGKPENKAGKVVVSHGAGTNGGYEIAKTYFQHGIDTLIYIHISPVDLEKLRADGIGNLIVTGHIASDSLGINPFIRELEKRGMHVTKIGVIEG